MQREIITFQCTECKNRNYSSTKNKKTTTERIELSKFCRHCRKHQAHKEIKQNGLGPRGVGLTADQRSPKPRVGVRIPPPLPTTPHIVWANRKNMADEKKNFIDSTRDYVDS